MREIRNSQAKLSPTRKNPLWLLAFGITLASFIPTSAWAENYPLESVDFTSSDSQTNIILHTGSIVPVQKVLVSNDKLILEIDQIEANDTIRTNFTGASNISHVIIQPLNDHKIRMIVRGQRLGAPSLAFYNAHSGAYSNPNPTYSAANKPISGPSAEISDDTLPTTLPQDTAPLPQESATANTAILEPSAASSKPASLPPQTLSTENGDLAQAPSLFQAANTKASPGKAPLPLSENANNGTFLDGILSWAITGYLPYALLGVLLLGLTLFIRNKVQQLQGDAPQLEDLIEDHAQGKRISFREMADAYRHKHDSRQSAVPDEAPAKPIARKNSNAEKLIGLRSLNQVEMDWEEEDTFPLATPAPRTAPNSKQAVANASSTLEQMLAAMQKAQAAPQKRMPTPPPKKQVVNQYAQQTQSEKPALKSRQAVEQKMQQEAKRAAQLQQELAQQALLQQSAPPVNRAKAAQGKDAAQKSIKPFVPPKSAPATNPVNANKKRPGGLVSQGLESAPLPKSAASAPRGSAQNGPLPGNPEVLNFLRNVAELMEKDGKTDIAKNIHKNLGVTR